MTNDDQTANVSSTSSPVDTPSAISGNGAVTQDQAALIVDLQSQLAKMTDLAARAQADLQNFKVRKERENEEFRKFANVPLLLELLHVYDDINRACDHEESSTEGLAQIFAKLKKILADAGVEGIPSLGMYADPHQHEVINAGPGEKDVITAVHQEGFTLHGRVLRPAKVQVGNGRDTVMVSTVEP